MNGNIKGYMNSKSTGMLVGSDPKLHEYLLVLDNKQECEDARATFTLSRLSSFNGSRQTIKGAREVPTL